MNIQPIIDKARYIIDRHRLSDGAYARWIWQDENGSRHLGVNEYGCADAANILYMIGQFVQEPGKRKAWIDVLHGLQSPETGLFHEPTHHTIHTTAHCIAALELFDASPLYPLKGLEPYLETEKMYALLEGLDWEHSPWNNSHQGAGLFAALSITRSCTLEWKRQYFAWLREHADPITGLGLKDRRGDAPLSWQLFGWFHYFFNHEFVHQPIPYPERIIDSCISMYQNHQLGEAFGREANFREIDWVYTMNRASRQTTHRFDEVKTLLADFAGGFLRWLDEQDADTHDELNDLHMLFGAMCAVAELQIALPGMIESDYPMKNVLDRRPFI